MPCDMVGMGGVSTPADPDYGDSVSVAGTLGTKSDFDRRKKKRYLHRYYALLSCNFQWVLQAGFLKKGVCIIVQSFPLPTLFSLPIQLR